MGHKYKVTSFSNSWFQILHCKQRLDTFPSPAGMSLTKLSLGGNNWIIPGNVTNLFYGEKEFGYFLTFEYISLQ